MHAMVSRVPGAALQLEERTDPKPGNGEIRIKVSACGVCRTDLHVVDAELPNIRYTIIPGHEIVGRLDLVGSGRDTPLDPAIIYAPAGELAPAALRAVREGGRVVCAGIHMSDIPSFPYDILWEERQLVSIANLTRQDGPDFLKAALQAGIKTETTTFPLVEANAVLTRLRTGQVLGAAVLTP
jgi:D-arabinose 1-dehydrogenase-like Zn-dependent alcohol dehydrogenase